MKIVWMITVTVKLQRNTFLAKGGNLLENVTVSFKSKVISELKSDRFGFKYYDFWFCLTF